VVDMKDDEYDSDADEHVIKSENSTPAIDTSK
jgi:hypothetical protein